MIKFTITKSPDGWDWTMRLDGSTIAYSNKYSDSREDALKEVKALVAAFKNNVHTLEEAGKPEINL